tara:strand:+ start:3385 stop:3879 length:495 start_codon:yes stop_codon:yes gene_type:complete
MMASVSRHSERLHRIQYQIHGQKRRSFYVEGISDDEIKNLFSNVEELLLIQNNKGLTKQSKKLSDWLESIRESAVYSKLIKAGLLGEEEKSKVKKEPPNISFSWFEVKKISSVLDNFYSYLTSNEYPFSLNEIEFKRFLEARKIIDNKTKKYSDAEKQQETCNA